jgi:hypothetical protein
LSGEMEGVPQEKEKSGENSLPFLSPDLSRK